ncbi:hypothetical protein NHX12_014111 [Muraenolepis orangiensis]|uniref:Uncharacterized protein n=1 Tax=Muraenolepis orangiensis TaxID=630683 RepID=A0A9Q0DEY1_9TELE|nr:hypothetical protein NHX12_014111 [Muraenolepis orangiensis]
MITRQDRVLRVQNTDGTLTVEHADGTTITSFYQEKTSTHRHTERGPHAERVVLVEREGLASVALFQESGEAHVFLPDGTLVVGDGYGVYRVFPSSTGKLLIGQDGTCVYSTDPAPSSPGSQSGRYRLSTTHTVTCDITDPEGNHFQDGSGAELLESQEVERLLRQADSEPSVALLTDHSAGQSTITILRPVQRLPGQQSLIIRPPNLRNHNCRTYPEVERKSPVPPLGSDPGRGPAVRGRPPVQALQVQELRVYPPTSGRLRDTLDCQLKGFMEHLLMRKQLSDDMKKT